MIPPEPQSIQSTRRQVGASTPADGPQQEAAAFSPLPPQQDAVAAGANRGGGSPGRTKPPVSQVEAAARAFAGWLISFMARSPSSDRNVRPPATVGSRGFRKFPARRFSPRPGRAALHRAADLRQGELARFVVVDDADQRACRIEEENTGRVVHRVVAALERDLLV